MQYTGLFTSQRKAFAAHAVSSHIPHKTFLACAALLHSFISAEHAGAVCQSLRWCSVESRGWTLNVGYRYRAGTGII